MFNLVRDDIDQGGIQGWANGEDVQIIRDNSRVHLLYGLVLNVSFPEKALRFHAGKPEDLLAALQSLAVELPAGALARLAAHAPAQHTGYPIIGCDGASVAPATAFLSHAHRTTLVNELGAENVLPASGADGNRF